MARGGASGDHGGDPASAAEICRAVICDGGSEARAYFDLRYYLARQGAPVPVVERMAWQTLGPGYGTSQ